MIKVQLNLRKLYAAQAWCRLPISQRQLTWTIREGETLQEFRSRITAALWASYEIKKDKLNFTGFNV